MPEGSRICEAQRRIVYCDRSRGRQLLERRVNRLLVLARDELFGQLRAPFIELRSPLFHSVGGRSLLGLEYMKSVICFDPRVYIAGPDLLDWFFKHFRQLPLIVVSEPAPLYV